MEGERGGWRRGRPPQLVSRDDESNPGKGLLAARELVQHERVAVLFGGLDTPVSLAIVPFANQAKVPFVGVWAAGTNITRNGAADNYVFRVSAVDAYVGEALVALLGANGAGKSTTMRALSGLLRPVSGAVILSDQAIKRLPAHEIARRGLALVPEGRQVFPELSVLDNIRIGAYRRGKGDYSAEIETLLRRFPRLRGRLHLRAGLLSGGEQQMLAVARGLMAKPQILLLDEPSLGLAPQMIEELFSVLADLREEGITILLVDQAAALTLAIANRGYVLEQGEVVRADSAEALRGDPALEAAYLGNERVSTSPVARASA